MARPEGEPQTALAQRLRTIRATAGDEDRVTFAARLGISKSSLFYYERGERTPDADVIARYISILGVNANWLMTGDGVMFNANADIPASQKAISVAAMKALTSIANRVHKDAGIKLSSDSLVQETTLLYNELVERVPNIDDMEEVEAVLPQIELILKRRLQAARAEPGTGKRLA